VSKEWPRGIEGWNEVAVREIEKAAEMTRVHISGCQFGWKVEDPEDKECGEIVQKNLTISTNVEELKEDLRGQTCPGNHKHAKIEGKRTKASEEYP
jgi:hypothetical protein